MKEYLLFIDTEASGLPRNWNAPFWEEGNWPHVVQVSWLIYNKDGQLLKEENHFVNDNDFEITPSALAVHGITKKILLQQGEGRKLILSRLNADLHQYQPLVIGHFMKFDALVLGAEYFRTGLENHLEQLPSFCTMEASAPYVRNPRLKYLRLGNLYESLFHTTLLDQHNALADARATAACFFEMVKKGDINEKTISQHQVKLTNLNPENKKIGCGFTALGIFILTVLLNFWL